MSDIIELNVGGVHYTTTRTTLTRHPDSMLGHMFSGDLPSATDKEGRVFIDRDGEIFKYILNFLRTSSLPNIDSGETLSRLMVEAEFYQISAMKSLVKILMDSSKPDKQKASDDSVHIIEVWYGPNELILYGPVPVLEELVNMNSNQRDGPPVPICSTKTTHKLYVKGKRYVCKPEMGKYRVKNQDGIICLLNTKLVSMGGSLQGFGKTGDAWKYVWLVHSTTCDNQVSLLLP